MFNHKKPLIPYPQSVSEYRGEVCIGKFSEDLFSLNCSAKGDIVDEAIKLFWTNITKTCMVNKESSASSYQIFVEINKDNQLIKGKSEAYTLSIGERCTTLSATDEAGIYYGVITLTNLVYTSGDDIYLPITDITDYPDFAFRSQLIECRYGSDFMTLSDYKSIIDYLASIKQNAIHLAVYGCWGKQYDGKRSQSLHVPIKKYPMLRTPHTVKYYSVKKEEWIIREACPTIFEEDFLPELADYAKRRNITIIPLINSYGHNSLIPRIIPETSAKNEDGTPKQDAVCFCTNSDKTIEVMCNIYDEIIDRYILPFGNSSIAIGFDEVRSLCQCDKCRDKEPTELAVEYLIKLCKHLKIRGMKTVYVYHDFLFEKKNVLNDDLRDRFIKEGIYDIICITWWNYGVGPTMFAGKTDEITSAFRGITMPMTGYYHWSIPSQINENIRTHALLAQKHGFEGFSCYGTYDDSLDRNFLYSADLAWNMSNVDNKDFYNERYAMRVCPQNVKETIRILNNMDDMMRLGDETGTSLIRELNYYSTYSYTSNIKPYPDGAFKAVLENKFENMAYLKYILEKSNEAMEFFAGGKTHLANVWELTAMQYKVFADIFYTMTDMCLENGSKLMINDELKAELDRLLSDIELLMSKGESIRIEANSYAYLRDLSITRQFILDLIRFTRANNDTEYIDITDLSAVISKTFVLLR